jgi:tetratricopeptide (TPR) repeat protein
LTAQIDTTGSKAKNILWQTKLAENVFSSQQSNYEKSLKYYAYHCFRKGSFGLALLFAGELYGLKPDSFEVNSLLGDIYLFGKLNPESAILYYTRAKKINPQDKSVRINLFRAYYLNKDYTTAIKLINEYLKENPTETRAWSTLGECYIEFGRLVDAQKAFAKAIRFAPEDPEKYILLAEAYMDNKQFDESLRYLKIAQKMEPDNPDTYLDIGEIYYWRGDYKNAEILKMKAMKMDPAYFSPYNEMGNLRFLQKRYNEAEKYHKASLDRFPTYHDAYRGLGRVYMETGRYYKAEAAFLMAIKLKPRYYGEMYVYLSEVYIKTGRFDKAEKALLNGVRTDENYPGVYEALAKFYKNRNLPEKAGAIDKLKASRCKGDSIAKKTGQ